MIVYKDLNGIKEDYIIITKSDVENLGKKTLKDVYEILNIDLSDLFNDELIEKIKKENDKFYRYLKLYLKNEKKVKYDKKVKYFKSKNEDEDEDEDEDEIKKKLKMKVLILN